MKIPKTLKLGAHTITVLQVENIADVSDSALGAVTHSTNTIELKKAVCPSQKEVTLLHEIFHLIDAEMDHEKLELLSQALYQVLKDNKLYFDGVDDEETINR